MPNDQFGRPVAVGDTVTLVGEVTKILQDPNFINCTVKLHKPMPPSGTETNLQLNTAQLEKKGGNGGAKGGQDKSQAQDKPHPQDKPQPPQPHGASSSKK